MTQTPELRRLTRLAAGYNRKAERLGVHGRITAMDLLVVSHLNAACAYCGITLEPGHGSFDHIIPLDRGGPNRFTNMTRCCMSCQRAKFTKTPREFEQHQALVVTCSVCGTEFKPRWAEYQRGDARVCSRSCAGKRRWQSSTSARSTPAPGALDGKRTMGKEQ